MSHGTFSKDDANTLARWIDDVCGESLQFPAHRRSEFAAYSERLRLLRAGGLPGKSGGASLFQSSGRSGTRETIALKNLLSSLRRYGEVYGAKASAATREVESVRRVLSERAVATSSATHRCQSGGYEALDGGTAYAARRKLAERYVAELTRQREAERGELAACRERHAALMDQKEQLRKEVHALAETERTVVERFEETRKALEAERDALQADLGTWKEMEAVEGREWARGSNADGPDNVDNDREEETQEKISLRQLRLDFAAVNAELVATRAALTDADASHAVRFRQSRQRLKDWQDMVEHLRRVDTQLALASRALGELVEASAGRLEAERSLSYGARLKRLNETLVERTAESLGWRQREEEKAQQDGKATQPLHTPIPVRSKAPQIGSETDGDSANSSARRASSTASSSVASSAHLDQSRRSQSEWRAPTRRRRRRAYALLTQLQKWDTILLEDAAAMQQVAENGVRVAANRGNAAEGDTKPSAEMMQCFAQLKKMLL